jgi:hypothetical protein
MKQVAAFVFGLTTLQGAVMYDRDPIGVNGRGMGHLEFFDGFPINQSWSLEFAGSDGFVSVTVTASGSHGSLGMGVIPGPMLLSSHGVISDTGGDIHFGYAGYSLATLPETAELLTLYEYNGGPVDFAQSYEAIASVPIWGHFAANFIGSTQHGQNSETHRYEIAIHTPEPAAWQLFAFGVLMFPVIRRYVIQRRVAVLRRQR